ncbi:MAG: hypothetical protein COB67_07130 [SAR324 cluster bacterium]|uniref:histidine kinase n=1 Tax=SAR324 cluster bacterium TaxID=2024889 RepID=A0A2A4T493_9DELT|nr:MAG: hypothetical protein COB67_07130 [SAR324 cluster bacterium]
MLKKGTQHKEDYIHLKSSRLFRHLPLEYIEEMKQLSDFKRFLAGTKLLQEGQRNDRVFFLLKGKVGIYSQSELIMHLQKNGDIFGEMSVISNQPCSATVIAETDVELFSLHVQELNQIGGFSENKLLHIFYQIFSSALTEKLAYTTKKAERFEKTNRLLGSTRDQLQKANDGLEKRVEQRTVELIQANKKLQEEIVERKRMEADLRQSQKMQSLGTLAGGIAHDFNNVLYAMLGYAELAQQDVSEKTTSFEFLQEVLVAGKRAKDLIAQILTFSRQNEQELVSCDVTSLLKEALQLIRVTLPSSIEIKMEGGIKQALIYADPVQIHQVIMNLCANSCYAMKKQGGQLLISLDNQLVDESFAQSLQIRSGNYIKLGLSDTGVGIAPDIMEQIFDPYFTTKPLGEGTGMGLAVVHGVIKKHQGAILVKNNPLAGVSFEIYLPVIQAAVSEFQQVNSSKPQGQESILVVDDEPAISKMTEILLTRLGYFVESTVSSREALDKIEKDPYAYDLVLTDQTMPYLTGDQLAEKILTLRPELPIILVTGYGQDISVQRAKKIGFYDLLIKPVMDNELAQVIRSALDQVNEEKNGNNFSD